MHRGAAQVARNLRLARGIPFLAMTPNHSRLGKLRPGPEICRSNRVELEILPRTGDRPPTAASDPRSSGPLFACEQMFQSNLPFRQHAHNLEAQQFSTTALLARLTSRARVTRLAHALKHVCYRSSTS
jgi:hypothetical protein